MPTDSPPKVSVFVKRLLTNVPACRARCLLAVILPWLLLHGYAPAAEFTSLELGLQRRAHVGAWMPVEASASQLSRGQNVSLVVTTRDARGNSVTEICASGTSGDNGQVSLQGLVRTGRLDGEIQVQIVDAGSSESLCATSIQCLESELTDSQQTIQQQLRLYRHDVRFLLTIGQPAGIDSLVVRAESLSPEAPAVVGLSVDSAADLPSDIRAYQTFSMIVLTGAVPLTEPQFDALRSWVYSGGRLVIGCGDGIGELLSTPFGQWLNELFDVSEETRPVTDADLTAMQQVVPQATRISTYRRTVNMVPIQSDQPEALAKTTRGPLVARTGAGSGDVTFIAVNLSQRPLSQWNSLEDFYAVMLLGEPLSRIGVRTAGSRISSSGVSDLTTQLMATVDPLPGTGRWTAWSIIALAFAWLVVVGPVDYLLVVVLFKRPHLTWITFPVWVLAAVAGLYSLKSGDTDVTLNSVHLIDVTQDGDHHSISATSHIPSRAEGSPRQSAERGNSAADADLVRTS